MQKYDERYTKILDDLLEQAGGKEYCLRQILTHWNLKIFNKGYLLKNRKKMINMIKDKFYENLEFNESDFINVEISTTLWNKHIFKFYFYDSKNHVFFEYSIKTDQVEKFQLFDGDDKNYQNSFFAKLGNGNCLWKSYQESLVKKEDKKVDQNEEQVKKEIDEIMGKMKSSKAELITEMQNNEKIECDKCFVL
jgi:hypothetical protein